MFLSGQEMGPLEVEMNSRELLCYRNPRQQLCKTQPRENANQVPRLGLVSLEPSTGERPMILISWTDLVLWFGFGCGSSIDDPSR